MRDMKDSGVEWIGKIPDKWQINRLKNNVQCHFGGCWGEEPKGDENDRLCIRIADFNYANQSVKNEASTYRNYTESQLSKCTLKNHDLILEKSGGGDKTPVGRVVIYSYERHPEALFANFSECLRLNDISYYIYVAYHLKALYYNFDMSYYFHQTTGIQNIDLPAYLNIILCTPNKEEQQKIATYLDTQCAKVDTLIANQQSQIEKLKSYKQSLITEVVTKGLDKNVPMKDSGVEWIGEISSKYNLTKLKFIITSLDSGVSVNAGAEPAKDTQYGVLKTSSVSQQYFIPSENKNVNSYEYDRVKCPVIKNTLIVSRMNTPDLVGACAYVDKDYPNLFLPDRLWRIFINDTFNTKYIWYFLSSKLVRNYYASLSSGTSSSMQNISQGQFESVSVVSPSITEQNEIVIFLDNQCSQIDFLISLKQQKIEKLQQYKKSLIYEYVTGKKEVE